LMKMSSSAHLYLPPWRLDGGVEKAEHAVSSYCDQSS